MLIIDDTDISAGQIREPKTGGALQVGERPSQSERSSARDLLGRIVQPGNCHQKVWHVLRQNNGANQRCQIVV